MHNRAVQKRDVVDWLCGIGMCSKGIVHNRFVSKKQSEARKMWMTECAQTKCTSMSYMSLSRASIWAINTLMGRSMSLRESAATYI